MVKEMGIQQSAVDLAKHRWPEGAVVYEVNVRSFQDTNGDGIGDLAGVRKQLDYLQDLGVNALWLTPFYPSPMVDFGYDVADYCNVDPMFGNLDDVRGLLRDIHARGLRLIIDLVPNHTSDMHAWFQASRQSRRGRYADWYIWQDPHPDSPANDPQPPNNWRDALTGGPAWQWEPQRQQFYLHSFHARQPDLNWGNQAVREALKDVMRFWLDIGVDGFRVDAVYWMAKDALLRDDTPNPLYVPGKDAPYDALLHDRSRGSPAVYAYLAEMAAVLKEEPYADSEHFMVTEAYPEQQSPVEAYMAFYNGVDPQVAAPFNFEGLLLPWKAGAWRQFLQEFHAALGACGPYALASYAFGNHDKPRLASRLGEAAARSAAVMQFSLPGMTYVYYGEEIGMRQVAIPPAQVHDPAAAGNPGWTGRDPQRTPMQWTAGPQAGFSEAIRTWLPLAADFKQHNVDVERTDPGSFLQLYRTLGKLRANMPALRYGDIKIIDIGQPDVLAYTRTYGRQRCLALINFSDLSVTCRPRRPVGQLLVSSEPESQLAHIAEGKVELLPHEAALFV